MTEQNEKIQHFVNLQKLHNQVDELFGYAFASDYLETLNVVTRSFVKEELAQEENNLEYTQDILFQLDQLKVFLVKMREIV